MQREQEIDVKYFKFVTEFYNNQKSGHVKRAVRSHINYVTELKRSRQKVKIELRAETSNEGLVCTFEGSFLNNERENVYQRSINLPDV